MRRFLSRWMGDTPLVSAVLLLSLLGIAVIYSAGVTNIPTPGVASAWKRQLVWLLLGLAAFTAVSRVPLRWVEWAAFPSYVLSVFLLGATLVVGTGRGTAQGVKSWIELGGVGFQPAEVAKLATILALARLLASRNQEPGFLRDVISPTALLCVPLGLVVLQPDLGTALAFAGILFAVLYWAGTPIPVLALLASPGLGLILSFNTWVWSAYMVSVAGFVYLYRYRLYLVESVGVVVANVAAGTVALPLWRSLATYQQNRLLVFLDPTLDPRGAGWHLIQSKVAIGSGGLLGKGFTLGTQKRLAFLPEQHTDFVFSVVGEELGFVGTLALLLGFAYMLYRLIQLAERSADPFAGFVLFGIFGAWIVHIFVNVGMTVGLVPITGIPLPLVSYGGSFLLMTWVATGLAVRLAAEE